MANLTKAQRRCLEDMARSGRMRKRSNGRWSIYPHGEFNSRLIWHLNELGFCGIGIHDKAQITNAGRAALGQL